MKKIFLITLLCISANSFAQLLQFGPIVSTNITSISTNDYHSDSSGNSVGFGGFARVNLLMLYGQAEFGYAQSKFTISETGLVNTDYKLSGTEASLIVGYKIVPLGKLGNVRIFGGYNWKNYSSIDTSNNLNYIDIVKNNNSFIGGVGVDLWKLTLDYRYLGGITDIDASNAKVKTAVSNISLGFKF
ncbi:outer membrane beta-barrel protein [Flavobacterium branchiarum]|uniref:Outer membrane beta-barrel protein n=1 Tax=Flavobacterium branchiarum TaxID=1114870 RepID=A0ABV5FK66_9FLAO|nr:outer membrane beta-barrel protein [Flavobacterium branchiarum]MDN3672379.1 outer membrane beta-barrel protein [Flavobacterium branchiarum]